MKSTYLWRRIVWLCLAGAVTAFLLFIAFGLWGMWLLCLLLYVVAIFAGFQLRKRPPLGGVA